MSPKIKDQFYCNDILEEREVVCSSERMVVNLSFRRPFNGFVFAQGQFHQDKCKWRGNGSHYLLVILPLREATICGMRYDPLIGEHSVMLIVATDPQILTQQSLALAVSCAHARKEQLLTLTIGSPSIDAGFRTLERESFSALLAKTPPIPPLRMRILDGHGLGGHSLSDAAVGQRLTLDAVLGDNSLYDMFLHTCIAHDGTKSPEASVMMVDENGCAIRLPRAVDGPAMVSPQNDNFGAAKAKQQPKHVYVHFYGFQFTSGPMVQFECQVTLCLAPCGVQQCAQNGAIHGSPSAQISSRTLTTQLQMHPQILQPAPIARSERLTADENQRPIYYGVNCTDLAWLLLLGLLAILVCIASWTIFTKLQTVIVGIYKAMKA